MPKTKEKEQQVEEVEATVEDELPTETELDEMVEVEELPSTELAVIDHERSTAIQPATTLPTPGEWEATLAVAKQIAATPFVPESYRNQPESVVAAILTGRELGIGPMQALRDIHMIDGRPAFSAQLMLAKMRAGGVVVIESEATAEHARIKARRSDTGEEGEFTFSKADAEQAGLTGKKNWKTYPEDMLWARAVGRMARRFGSDLLGGMVYAKEEIEDWGDGGYGIQGSGYDADTFDAGTSLLPGAIRGENAVEELNAAQKRIAADLDWPAMLEEAALACIGPREGRTPEQRKELLHRWSNTIAKLQDLAAASAVYHPDLGLQAGEEGDGIIVAAFEFGFGVTPSLPLPKAESEAIESVAGESAAQEEASESDSEGETA